MFAMKFVAIAALVALAAAAPPSHREHDHGLEGHRLGENRLHGERRHEEPRHEEPRHEEPRHEEPRHEDVHRENAKIEEQTRVGPNKDGSWSQSFKTSNGISVKESGKQVPSDSHDSKWGTANSVEGSVSYKGKDGKEYELTYVADANGYRPSADYLPTPPPTPEAIARSLEWIAAHPNHEGSDGKWHPKGWNSGRVEVPAPRHEEPRHEEPRHEVPRHEVPRHELPRVVVAPRHEAPRVVVAPRHEAPRVVVAPRHEEPRRVATHVVAPHHDAPHVVAPHHDAPHVVAPHHDAPHVVAPHHDAPHVAPHHDAPRHEENRWNRH